MSDQIEWACKKCDADNSVCDCKQEPVVWSLIFNNSYGVNAETTFKTKDKAVDYARRCGTPDSLVKNPDTPIVVPLYTHPSSVRRLSDNEIDVSIGCTIPKYQNEITVDDLRRLANVIMDACGIPKAKVLGGE